MSDNYSDTNIKLNKILLFSRDTKFKTRLKKILHKRNIQIILQKEINNLLNDFGKNNPDVLIINIAEDSGSIKPKTIISKIKHITDKYPGTQILILIKPRDIRIAASALKAGTYHYARFPITDEELALLVEAALEQKAQLGNTQSASDINKRARFGEILGSSKPMQKVFDDLHQAASSDVPVLILGETGTGKDLVAKAIHRISTRCKMPYVAVNLGALPIELVASELFGHVKGSFTGAIDSRKGVFEQAEGGTAFLDEIDSIDNKVQVSLLRLLEDKRFNRLGGQRAFRNRARIIAASNANLESLIAEGGFRKDLFYRLDIFRINLPPLRERMEDLPLLISDFINRYNRSLNKKVTNVSSDCMRRLKAFEWPGNVRELKNVIQRAMLVCRGRKITSKHLPKRFSNNLINEKSDLNFDNELRLNIKLGTPLLQVEKIMVIRALEYTQNNRKKAAELLGISRRALYNKLKKFDIE
jgi:DNA-binding NtrC family response regulator